jgi:hypothetical protein
MLKTVSSVTNAIGALNYKGTWNASTNTPTLVSGTGTKGDYYQVSVAGNTAIDGISNWGVGDVIAFNGTTWQRIEGGADLNGVNLSVSGVADFAAGTATDPSITTTGDTDTGLFFPAPNTVAVSTNGTEKARVTEDGTVLVGTTNQPIAPNRDGVVLVSRGLLSSAGSTSANRAGFWQSMFGLTGGVTATTGTVVFKFKSALATARLNSFIKLSVLQRASSDTASLSPAAEYWFRLFQTSAGVMSIQDDVAIYESIYVKATHFAFANLGGGECTITLTNPTGVALDAGDPYKVEILASQGRVFLDSVTST